MDTGIVEAVQSVPGTIVGPGLDLRGDVVGKIRVGRRRVLTDPSTEPAAALSCVYNPDRNPQRIAEIVRKHVPNGRAELCGVPADGGEPVSGRIVLGRIAAGIDGYEKPHLAGMLLFRPVRRLGRLGQGPFHVRLAARYPDFAEHQVFHRPDHAAGLGFQAVFVE